ncbi:MAG: class I SAM-dependent methyltransferase [Parashewanella sp.]
MKNSTHAGQAIYNKFILSIYDLWVLGISNRFFWRCPTRHIRRLFKLHTSTNHLDVGVGTGFYPAKELSKTPRRYALLDLNQNSLDATSKRIAYFSPEKVNADVLSPIVYQGEAFDSISLNYLLHCLPGDMTSKATVFLNLTPLLTSNGILFGSTILGRGVRFNYCASKLMSLYNQKGFFSNTNDDLQGLRNGLEQHFEEVDINVIGCVALFTAKKLLTTK